MTENLQNALSDLIGKTLKGIDATTGFLQDEIPEVVQQLLIWHGVYSFLTMCTAIILLGVSYILYLVIKTEVSKDDINWWTGIGADACPTLSWWKVFICGISVIIMTIISIVQFNILWLQIWIAPKVFLIEYMVNLVK